MFLTDVLSNVFLLYAYNLFNRSLLCENIRPYGGLSKQPLPWLHTENDLMHFSKMYKLKGNGKT